MTGELTSFAAGEPKRRIPNMYADPVSWLTLEAVDDLWSRCPDDVRATPSTTAMVLVSTHSTLDTMTAIARAVPSGRLSPLRFAGASAGHPVSLVCQAHGFRGPTLVLTTAPEDGHPTALVMARHWLRTGAATQVVVARHDRQGVRCDLLR